jgi:hypothetical protein
MAKDFIGYEALDDPRCGSWCAKRLQVARRRAVGSHHFYCTFKTHDPAWNSRVLKERYPDEMTIVLQNQFSGLTGHETAFEVTLSFQKLPATIVRAVRGRDRVCRSRACSSDCSSRTRPPPGAAGGEPAKATPRKALRRGLAAERRAARGA